MEANKILSANILDLIFDGRNKEYGAYELRVTYPERVKKSMIVVFIIAAFAIAGAALANSFTSGKNGMIHSKVVTIREIKPEVKEPILPPEPKKPEIVETKTEMLTTEIKMVTEDVDPLPTQDDFKKADVGVTKQDGPDDVDLPKISEIDNGTGIIEPPKDVYDGPRIIVEVDAKFNGNWEKFLRTNLDPGVPVDKGAPVGKYNVIIQFVVDVDGSVSDIKPLTAYGYGMEEEAIRVLKKALKWEPAFQNGHHVKAYRRQPVTFIIEDGN